MATNRAVNLFQAAQSNSSASSSSRYIVELKAGKLQKEGTTVTADPRKGLLYFNKSAEDGLLHLYWRDRSSQQVEDDLILFPDEAELVHVPQCKTGLVYCLKFKTSSQRLFFWIQEELVKKAGVDNKWGVEDANLKKTVDKIRKVLKDGPPAQSAAASGAGGGALGEDEQLMRLLASQGLDLNALRGGSQSPTRAQAATATSPSAGQQAVNVTRLSEVLSLEMMNPILSDAAMRAQLFPHLPQQTTPMSEQDLRQLILSAPFQQAVNELDSALKSGQLNPLLREWGLNVDEMTQGNDAVLNLLRAIHRKNAMDESQ